MTTQGKPIRYAVLIRYEAMQPFHVAAIECTQEQQPARQTVGYLLSVLPLLLWTYSAC